MSIIIRKTEEGYQMVQNGEVTHENLKVVFDNRKGCGDIRLPENSLGKKWLSESRFVDGVTEVDLFNLPSRSTSTPTSTPKTSTLSWENYLTEEEKAIVDEIKAKALARKTKKDLEDQIKALTEKLNQMD